MVILETLFFSEGNVSHLRAWAAIVLSGWFHGTLHPVVQGDTVLSIITKYKEDLGMNHSSYKVDVADLKKKIYVYIWSSVVHHTNSGNAWKSGLFWLAKSLILEMYTQMMKQASNLPLSDNNNKNTLSAIQASTLCLICTLGKR